ncbi:MAG TPA: pantoate--beta-alanine ligase [Candidatus Omnitrophota bacterium]|nr:pantoate--beta-alanine ligase [Candidatus Omnitrophota bacterium]
MKIIKSPKILHQELVKLRLRDSKVGFVPTMGALHDGHLSLVRASNRENDVTVVSIFVNPTQFGPREDFSKYPRVFGKDKKLLQRLKVDFLFCPSVRGIYPEGLGKRGQTITPCLPPFVSNAKWPRLAKGLCGKFRPGHFQGVVTVVSKLLNIVGSCRLYLGAKDYQQAVVIRQMVKDYGLNARVRIQPIVREKDGLAMSSRNRYLSQEERLRARKISQVLFALKRDVLKREKTLNVLKNQTLTELKKHVGQVQYLEIVDPVTLIRLKKFQRGMAALTACFVGKTRLIDNVIIRFP